ncbi:MAG: lysophospholipid acyltransferase family protein [Synergistaceae bacterium]|jgi:KDO2-lipid IV(A) lauroyltransferase|nr:lysophospholipid acyltransferase family protein [Synergistaceae bacterium]
MSFKASAIRFLMKIVRPGASAACLALFFRGLVRLAPIRKQTAARNLEIALPEKTPRERGAILWKTYDHLIWMGIEFAALQRDPRLVLDWVDFENESALDDSKGGILLASHVGNWELCGSRLAQGGHVVTAIVRESCDDEERGVIAEMRVRAGWKFISHTSSMMPALAVLKRNEFLAIMPDQHASSAGIAVPFFGLATSTPQGPAVFAYLTKKPIIPVYIRRIRPFKHVMRIGEPIKWEDTGERGRTIYGITAAVNREVEQMVREAPDQWLAQHKRFKEHY